MNPIRYVCLVLLMESMTFFSCTFFSGQREYTLVLPSLPEQYSFVRSWTVEIRTGQGDEATLSLSAAETSFVISAGKEERLLVLAHACGPGSFSLKPAGQFLDGYARCDGHLSFEAGPPVAVLAEAQNLGFDIRSFNCSRLLEVWADEGTLSPWYMDSSAAVEALVSGEFSLLKLKKAPLFPVGTAGGPGWIGDDPLGGPGIPPYLPPGNYCFYNEEGSLVRKISLDDEGHESSRDFSVNNL